MDDILDLSSNGPAYEKEQVRLGPPLEYVAEKLQTALLLLHGHCEAERKREQPPASSTPEAIFRYQMTAFLALKNMLHLAGDPDFASRLLEMPGEDFETWVENVSTEGSVTGK